MPAEASAPQDTSEFSYAVLLSPVLPVGSVCLCWGGSRFGNFVDESITAARFVPMSALLLKFTPIPLD
jgi:hypothetical protein